MATATATARGTVTATTATAAIDPIDRAATARTPVLLTMRATSRGAAGGQVMGDGEQPPEGHLAVALFAPITLCAVPGAPVKPSVGSAGPGQAGTARRGTGNRTTGGHQIRWRAGQPVGTGGIEASEALGCAMESLPPVRPTSSPAPGMVSW